LRERLCIIEEVGALLIAGPPSSGEKNVTRSLSRWQAILLGIIVLVAGGLAAAGLFAVGSRGWFGDGAFHVQSGFKEIRGVEPGTRVRIQGIDAGEVDSVDPPSTPGSDVMLRIRLKGQFRSLVRADAVVQIVSEGMLGGKVLEIQPGSSSAEPVADNAVLASKTSAELTDVLGQVGDTLKGIGNGEGTLGLLAKDPRAYSALLNLLQSSEDTAKSLKEDADAIKRLPIVRGYVEDPQALLVRQGSERNRRWFAEEDLFEPGRATLTAQGKRRLDELAPWMGGLKHKGSDVVVVAYADPKTSQPAPSRALTKQQSEAVVSYLKDNHAVQKMGWFSSRKVTPLGMGIAPPPVAEKDKLPPARLEVLIFVPQT
jgi:phospholipid/cholesterol/gamma-HCH transport system substrate-binding protein